MLKHLMEYIDFSDIDTDETCHNSPLTDKEFVKFLKDNDIYDRFMNNLYWEVKNQVYHYNKHWYSINTLCKDLPRSNYIGSSFSWKQSPEGYDFWLKYHNRWSDIVDLLSFS